MPEQALQQRRTQADEAHTRARYTLATDEDTVIPAWYLRRSLSIVPVSGTGRALITSGPSTSGGTLGRPLDVDDEWCREDYTGAVAMRAVTAQVTVDVEEM